MKGHCFTLGARWLLPGLVLLVCCACARKPLVVTLPAASASAGEQNAQAINSAISILRQLEGNPSGIEIQMRKPGQSLPDGAEGF